MLACQEIRRREERSLRPREGDEAGAVSTDESLAAAHVALDERTKGAIRVQCIAEALDDGSLSGSRLKWRGRCNPTPVIVGPANGWSAKPRFFPQRVQLTPKKKPLFKRESTARGFE